MKRGACVVLALVFVAIFSAFLLLPGPLGPREAWAATMTSTSSGGNWNATGTWSGGVVPLSTDAVQIASGATVTVTANATCASLSFQVSGSSTVSTGNVVVNSGITLTVTGAIAAPLVSSSVRSNCDYGFSGLGTVTGASLSIGPTTTPSSGTTSTVTLNSTLSALNISGGVTLNSRANTSGTRRNNAVFDIASGTVGLGGIITTVNQNSYVSSTVRMTTSPATGTLNLGSSALWSLSGTGSNVIALAGAYALVNYNRAGIQDVLPTAYTNLTLSGSGAKTFTAGNSTVNGTLSLEGTATVALTGTLTYGANATLQYKGASAQATGSEFQTPFPGGGGVKINNASGVTLGATRSLGANPLTIGDLVANSLLIDGGYQLTATGTLNLTSGTFRLGSGTATIFPGFATRNIAAGTTVEYAAGVAQTVAAVTYSNLTMSGAGGGTAAGNLTVNGLLNLSYANPSATKGTLDMGANTLSMGASATTTGTGDVTGIVKRAHTFTNDVAYSFGSQYTTIAFLGIGTKPGWVSCKIVIGSAPSWSTTAVNRYYSFAQDGTFNDRVILNLRYLDSELNSSTESKIVLWDAHNGPTWSPIDEHGKTNNDTTNNWVGESGLTISYVAKTSLDNKQWGIKDSAATKNTWLGASETNPTGWDDGTNWTAGAPPITTDNVLIPAGRANYPILTLNVEVASLEIEPGATVTANSYGMTINGSGGAWLNNGTFTSAGTVTFSHGVISQIVGIAGTGANGFDNLTINTNTYVQPATGSLIQIAGAVTNNGTMDCTATNNTVEYSGGSQAVVNPNGTTPGYHHLILSGSGTKTLPSSALSVTGNLTLAGTVTAAPGYALAIGGNFTLGSGTTFTPGSLTHAVGGNFVNNGGTFTATGSTVTLNGASPQTIGGSAATTFNNLVLNNSTGASLGRDATVGGSLTLTSGALGVGAHSLVLDGGVTGGGTITSDADGTVSYAQGSAGQNVCAGTYGNLTFSSYNKTLASSGMISIAGTFTAGSATGHTVTGSTVEFNGSGSQTIPAMNYNNLTSSGSGTRTVASSGTIGVAGTFTPGSNSYTVTGSTVEFNGSGPQTIPAMNYNNLTSSGSGARTLAPGGTIGVMGTFTPGSNSYTVTGSMVSFNGTSSQTVSAFTFESLTVDNNAGVAAGGDLTVNGALFLQSPNASATQGTLDMGANTLTMGASATTTGTGDVTGIVKRAHTFANGVAYSFGSQYTTIAFLGTGTKPGWVSCKIVIGSTPTWNLIGTVGVTNGSATVAGTGTKFTTQLGVGRTMSISGVPYTVLSIASDTSLNLATTYAGATASGLTVNAAATAVQRYYSFAQDGTFNDQIILNLGYLDSELNSNDESNIVLYDAHNGPTWDPIDEHGKNNNDIDNNWVGLSGRTIGYVARTSLDNKQWGIDSTAATKNTWLGVSEDDPTKWDDGTNWTSGASPVTTDNVLIPAGKDNYPVLTLDVEVTSLEIEPGATVTADSYGLTINGYGSAWLNNGVFTSSGTVTFSHGVGSHVVGIAGNGTNEFNNIVINANTSVQPATGSVIRIAGAVTNNGTLNCTAASNTVEYGGASQDVIKPNGATAGYRKLILAGSGTKTLPSSELTIQADLTITGTASAAPGYALTIGGDFALESGATFTAGVLTHTVGGDFVNDGATFTATGSTFIFSGSGAQSIRGDNTWHSLTISGSSARTVSFESGKTQDVSSSLTLNGAAAQLLTLAPLTGGSAWNLHMHGSTQSVSYVSPLFSDASGASQIRAFYSMDGGNNTNWWFGPTPPTVTTTAADSIDVTSASAGGTVTDDGGDSVTARGVCWSTSANPTTVDTHTTDGSGTGAFASSLTGLTSNTVYHLRAYATNSYGTAYGDDLTFTTLPVVTTGAIGSITKHTASGGGSVTPGGGVTITAWGVCWSTSANPTTADSHTTDAVSGWSFTSSLTGLSTSTTYHVRAYATNAGGTKYGDDVSFDTAANVAPTITSVVLQTSAGVPTSAMTPQVEYLLAITAVDNNTLADLTEIDIWIYHDTTGGGSPGAPPAGGWDADDCALYKWVPAAGGTWSLLNAAATSWTVETGVTPTLTNSSGIFKLAFKPGKLAIESTGADTDEWNFMVTVSDAAATSAASYAQLNSMAAYCEISTDVAAVTFGTTVALGATAYIATPANNYLTTRVLANDVYALQVNTTSTWTGAGTLTLDPSGTPNAAGEFGLNIDDATAGSGQPTTPQAVTTSAGTITGHATDARVATAPAAAEATADQNLYMGLTLWSAGIPHGLYSGTITFTVVNN